MASASELANRLHEYLTFRASREGVPHELPVSFYAGYIAQGSRSFFGIECNSTRILRDTQKPEIYAEWGSRRVSKF